ncbi:endonuclease/exonuclease/phosphatase family protein [Nonomuraea sp. bgisy101]|uniref:endonuclease/exonuclease/phosphatase family protein n=1 Tax=Nonomuraea sp. bgisy101 TaxID=3413784 RepID=UPI003D73AADB
MPEQPPLRVATFNIHHGRGPDDRLDLRRVADVIRAGRAGIAGLQEVDRHCSRRSEFVDQAAWVAAELGMDVVFGANLDLGPPAPGGRRRQYGTAILSRFPIRDSGNTFLPRFPGSEQRGLLRATIVVHGVPVQVCNTHLQDDDAAERLEQARAVRALITERPGPVILTGDFNALPGAPEIRVLTRSLRDAWAQPGAGPGHTFPATGSRIDYVFTSPDVEVRSATVVPCDASDHLPVFVDMLLPERVTPRVDVAGHFRHE